MISVIITTYKRPEILKCAIESVLNQTFKDVELIIVDDNHPGSLEHFQTRDVVEVYQKNTKDVGIVYVKNEKNSWLCFSRNAGISKARGEYIAFLDDDDIWMEHKLEVQLAQMNGFDILGTTVQFVGQGAYAGRCTVFDKKTVSLKDLGQRKIFCYMSAMLFKSEVFKQVSFDVEHKPLLEDLDLCLSALKKGFKLGMLNVPQYYMAVDDHRERLTNMFSQMSFEDLKKRLVFLDKHRKELGEWDYCALKAWYFLNGFRYRKDRWHYFLRTVRQTGLRAVLWTFYKRRMDRINLRKYPKRVVL